ncbi:hypothetical protein MP638_002302, partial [Amoeboaphelidium occidentale]
MSKRKSSPYSRNEDTSNSTDDDPMENDQIEVVDDLLIQNLSLQPTRNAWIPRWAKRIKTSISGAASDAASWLPSAFVQSVPKELWVRIEGGFPTGVTTEGCKNVDELKAIKKQLELRKPGNPLDPMMLLPDAVAKHGIRSDTVLIA